VYFIEANKIARILGGASAFKRRGQQKGGARRPNSAFVARPLET
jgi:hypothetical protein